MGAAPWRMAAAVAHGAGKSGVLQRSTINWRKPIRLHLDAHEVLQSHGAEVPNLLVVPPWSAWHYSLGDISGLAAGTEGIFLLKGDDFVPAYPADFQRGLDELTEVERILQKQRAGETGGA